MRATAVFVHRHPSLWPSAISSQSSVFLFFTRRRCWLEFQCGHHWSALQAHSSSYDFFMVHGAWCIQNIRRHQQPASEGHATWIALLSEADSLRSLRHSFSCPYELKLDIPPHIDHYVQLLTALYPRWLALLWVLVVVVLVAAAWWKRSWLPNTWNADVVFNLMPIRSQRHSYVDIL